jgi:hypothetical protein
MEESEPKHPIKLQLGVLVRERSFFGVYCRRNFKAKKSSELIFDGTISSKLLSTRSSSHIGIFFVPHFQHFKISLLKRGTLTRLCSHKRTRIIALL